MPVVQPKAGVKWFCNQAEDDGSGVFVVRCTVCNAVFLKVAIRPGEAYEYMLPTPQVPCHADGLEIGPAQEEPWERVARMLEEKPDKKPAPPAKKFMFSVQMMDGMIYQITIKREP